MPYSACFISPLVTTVLHGEFSDYSHVKITTKMGVVKVHPLTDVMAVDVWCGEMEIRWLDRHLFWKNRFVFLFLFFFFLLCECVCFRMEMCAILSRQSAGLR